MYNDIHPKLNKKIIELKQILKNQNINIDIIKTSVSKENFSKNEQYVFSKIHKRYPYCSHCFGLAVDFRIVEKNINNYEQVGKIGKELGLFWGGDFKFEKEINHLEMLEFLPNQSVKYLIYKYQTPENFKKTWYLYN